MKYPLNVAILCITTLCGPAFCAAAGLSGDWIAEIQAKGADPQYARVHLNADGPKITGEWSQAAVRLSVEGAASPGKLNLSLIRSGAPAGNLSAAGTGNAFAGEGQMIATGRGGGEQRNTGQMEKVAWKFTREKQPPAGSPRTIDFEPKEFHGYYSASYAPVLHVFAGDTVRTRTYDAARDPRSPGGNLETGPFYIEGALPGDTLIVKLNKLRMNRDSARQGSRINGRALTPAYIAAAQYDPAFDSEWKLDRAKGVAALAHPTERLKNFTVPILPMLGCISTAPAGDLAYRGTELGAFGGNMDYNQMGEGVTLYLPVFHAGALLTFGDAHAAMGDGEVTGSALETSADIEFTVDIVKGYASVGPRLENADYIMSMGVAGSVADSIQIATSQLGDWLKRDYRLNDSEVALFLGAVAKYDITELVDPQFNVVAKVPKTALASLK
ncbi:MAG TPA: acetamidase/formamidase family protein [Bryobacteraceae bacterium]|nr:acetamidase/formamidase family protein [Bryobacteraceae bacterium]